MGAHARAQVGLERILFATDFSERSAHALGYALGCARRFGSELFFTHVVDIDVVEFGADYPPPISEHVIVDAARKSMSVLLRTQELHGVKYSVLLPVGRIWEELTRSIHEHAVDLMILSLHGGGETQAVMHPPCPTLIAGAQAIPTQGFRRVLYVDDSEANDAPACTAALAMIEAEADVIVLRFDEHHGSEAARLSLRRPDLHVEVITVLRPSATVITDVAAEHQAGLIVMRVRQAESRGSAEDVSLAYAVVSAARCPVLLYP